MSKPNVRFQSTDRELHEAMGIRIYRGREIDTVNLFAWACVLAGVCLGWYVVIAL